MNLQQRYQRLGRDDSWMGALRDTVLLVIGLPVALGVAGMFVASKELPEQQQAAQAARQARRATLTATRRPRELRQMRAYQPPRLMNEDEMPADGLRTEPETATGANQPTTRQQTTRRTVW